MRYVMLMLMLIFAATAGASELIDWVTVRVQQTKYADQGIATTQSQKSNKVLFVGNPLIAECGRWVDIRSEVVGVITGPLDLALANGSPVRVQVRDFSLETDRGCVLQGVIGLQ